MPRGANVCSVATCKSNSVKAKQSGEILHFHSFPMDKRIRQEWVVKCYRNDKFNPANKKVCSKHFQIDDYEDGLRAKLMNLVPRKLKKTGVFST